MEFNREWNGIETGMEWNNDQSGMRYITELNGNQYGMQKGNGTGTVPASFFSSSSGSLCSPFRTLCSSCLSVDRL